MAHAEHIHRLQLVLFQPASGSNGNGGASDAPPRFVAAGSLGLGPLLEGDASRHNVNVPVVDEVSCRALRALLSSRQSSAARCWCWGRSIFPCSSAGTEYD